MLSCFLFVFKLGQIQIHLSFFISDLCEAIQVTDTSTSNSEGGLYLLSDDYALDAPNSPVWKNSGSEKFIFNTGSTEGWRIGLEEGLIAGGYFCNSKHIIILFTIKDKYSRVYNSIENFVFST